MLSPKNCTTAGQGSSIPFMLASGIVFYLTSAISTAVWDSAECRTQLTFGHLSYISV